VQVATALLEYCLADADAPADVAAARQLAGLHVVPLLSGDLAALQPDQAAVGGAPRLFLATAVQQRVLAGQAHLLLQCEVMCLTNAAFTIADVLKDTCDLKDARASALHCQPVGLAQTLQPSLCCSRACCCDQYRDHQS
jgi:hypothetical protein